VNEQKELAVGEDFAENGQLHRCYRLGGTIEYSGKIELKVVK
jgi:hypothetical protein